jgi:voltage-gated potassium channel
MDELTPRRRRWAVAFALLRSAAGGGLLVVAYYLLPLDQSLHAATMLKLAFGLVIFILVVCYEVWAIMRSNRPRLRAIQAISISLPLLLLIFAATYVLLQRNTAGSFTETITRTDSLYFTVTVFATVGFGDIAAVTEVARIVVTIQMIIDLIAIGLIAKVVLGAVQVAVRRQGEGSESPAEDVQDESSGG